MLICYVPCSLNQLAQLVTTLSVLLSGFSNGCSSVSNTISHRDRDFLRVPSHWTGDAESSIHLRLCVSQSKSLIQTRARYLVTRGEIWDKGKRTPWWGRICVDMFRAHLIITLSLDNLTTDPCRRGEPTRPPLYQMTWTSGSSNYSRGGRQRASVASLKPLKEQCQVGEVKFG